MFLLLISNKRVNFKSIKSLNVHIVIKVYHDTKYQTKCSRSLYQTPMT